MLSGTLTPKRIYKCLPGAYRSVWECLYVLPDMWGFLWSSHPLTTLKVYCRFGETHKTLCRLFEWFASGESHKYTKKKAWNSWVSYHITIALYCFIVFLRLCEVCQYFLCPPGLDKIAKCWYNVSQDRDKNSHLSKH